MDTQTVKKWRELIKFERSDGTTPVTIRMPVALKELLDDHIAGKNSLKAQWILGALVLRYLEQDDTVKELLRDMDKDIVITQNDSDRFKDAMSLAFGDRLSKVEASLNKLLKAKKIKTIPRPRSSGRR